MLGTSGPAFGRGVDSAGHRAAGGAAHRCRRPSDACSGGGRPVAPARAATDDRDGDARHAAPAVAVAPLDRGRAHGGGTRRAPVAPRTGQGRGNRRPIANRRWPSSSGRGSAASPSCCRSATGGWSRRRSRSSGGARRSWPPTSPTRPRTGLDGAAVRRRPPVQLRRLRGARSATRVQHQRLRRDAARARSSGTSSGSSASFAVAGRSSGFTPAKRAPIVLAAAAAYREAMRAFAGMSSLDVWYTRLDVDEIARRFGGDARAKQMRAIAGQPTRPSRRTA